MISNSRFHLNIRVECVLEQRQRILTAAYESHPERFVNGMPKVPELPKEVWINPPKGKMQEESITNSAEACE